MIRQILLTKQFNRQELLSLLNRGVLDDEAKLKIVRRILRQVRDGGDQALFKVLNEIEGQEFSSRNLKVDERTIKNSIGKIDRPLLRSLKEAAKRIYNFHSQKIPKTWFVEEAGIKSGMIVKPLSRVGIYVPGGRASYPSSLLMNAIPAQIAGVKEIIICTPANIEGQVNTQVLAAASIIGVNKIYKMGGAQAVAAMAYGTQTVPKVDKITGPGNIYVTLAKKEVSGFVGIDMLAGPSEVLIVADKDADAKIVAADMLAQSEHGVDAMAILLTDSKDLAKEVQVQVAEQLKRLNKDSAKRSLADFGLILLASSSLMFAEVINLIGSEHLLLYARRAKSLLGQVQNAGAIFVGRNSAVALGDYGAGPNHTLPTMGNASYASPLSVDDFVKKSSYLEVDSKGLEKLAPTVETIAKAEGLEAHAYSVEVRREA